MAALRTAQREAAEELAKEKAERQPSKNSRRESRKLPEARAEGLPIKDKPTLRTRPGKGRGTILGDRRPLRDRMRRQLGDPPWAHSPEDWDAHHILPVSTQNKPVFEVLRSRHPGWDHNDPILNGIALPRTRAAAERSGLPVHQVTREVLEESRRVRASPSRYTRASSRCFRGTPT